MEKRIFQTWKSKIDITDNFRYWQKTWKDNNPDYIYELWDDDDNRNFIKENYSWFLEKYDSYDRNIKRADAVRYFYLYHYGGIYADMDFECLKNFDDIINLGDRFDLIFGKMKTNEQEHEHNIPNAIMISKPKQDFWLTVFDKLMNTDSFLEPEESTGPVLLKKAIEEYKGNNKILLLKSFIFYPIDWTNEKDLEQLRNPVIFEKKLLNSNQVKKLFPKSYAVTYWAHTWG